MHLSCVLLTAAAAILPTHASPLSPSSSLNFLLPRDLSGTSCVPFVYGATNTQFDKVCVSVAGDTLTVTYPSLPSGGAYTDIHAIVQTTPVTEAIQGQWPYGLGTGITKSGCTINGGTATCSIPIQLAWRACNLKLYIGVHASFSLDGVNSQTGWADGTCIKARPNCPKYFVFTAQCQCPVVTMYEPITTSLVYTKTIYETHTTTCSMTPASITGVATCDDPNPGATKTFAETTTVAGFACASLV